MSNIPMAISMDFWMGWGREKSRLRIFLIFALFWGGIFSLLSSAQGQIVDGKEVVHAELISNVDAVVPGRPFQVGILLKAEPGWHTYWEYGGDAGRATQIEWSLPKGYRAGPIQWPLPRRFVEQGDLVAYAYGDEVLLLTEMVPSEEPDAGEIVIKAHVDWLVCAEICVPGNADLELRLPVAKEQSLIHEELFSFYRSQLPSESPPPFPVEVSRTGDHGEVSIQVKGISSDQRMDFFPLPPEDVEVGHVGYKEEGKDRVMTLDWPQDIALHGVLVLEDTSQGAATGLRRGWIVGEKSGESAETMGIGAVSTQEVPLTLWLALIYGFLGGVILNVMPCVLPVISLKIFGFIRQAGEDRGKILRHGLAFAGGIFFFFLSLGFLVVGLQKAGHQVTWAFQFQSPYFNLVMSVIVLVFALNLFGVFELILPGAAGSKMETLGRREGYGGSFFQGVFATLLATPCTAPYLGAALGFAFSQPPGVILSIFGSVALGMAFPYLLLSAQPAWIRWLPKPGAWMERVKQLMGFALLATLVWLIYILGVQVGVDGMVDTLAFLVSVGMACWVYGAFGSALASRCSRRWTWLVMAIVIGLGGWLFLSGGFEKNAVSVHSSGQEEIPWVEFSPEKLETLRKEGKGVFLDFTAAWCLSCKFNEKAAIRRPAVRRALTNGDFVPMRADWTNTDPTITATLKKFGRVGVPFYVIYPPGGKADPVILPEILTEQIVLNGLEKARQLGR